MRTVLTALALALVAIPPLRAVLRRAGVLDHPSARSSHSRSTVRGGGTAVVLAVLLAVALSPGGAADAAGVLPAVVALTGLAALGLLEDVHGVPAGRRLAGQLLVGSVAAGVAAIMWDPAWDQRWAAAAVLVAVVVYANAFNFMDGVNGISGLNAAFAGLVYAALGDQLDSPGTVVVALAVTGAALGFLPFNFPRATVFLGDTGSYALGGVLAVLAVQCWAAGAPLLVCAAPLSVYLVDTGWTLCRRWRRGASLVLAHRDHVYQQLSDRRPGRTGAALISVVAAALTTAAAALSAGTPLLVGVLITALPLVLYVTSPFTLGLLAGTGPVRRSPDLRTRPSVASVSGSPSQKWPTP